MAALTARSVLIYVECRRLPAVRFGRRHCSSTTQNRHRVVKMRSSLHRRGILNVEACDDVRRLATSLRTGGSNRSQRESFYLIM